MENLFVIGSPRSGTTFLASLLELTVYGEPFETQFILKYLDKLNEYGDIKQLSNLTLLISDIKKERAISQWQVDIFPADIKRQLGEVYTYKDVVDVICLTLMNSKNKSLWGDKTPHYILKLAQLVNLYPNAKYLYIVRDGRDVCLSLLKKPWGPNNIYSCARQWVQANSLSQHKIINELEQRGQLLKIKYETLVDFTESECKRIYEFLGEDINENKNQLDVIISKTISGNHSKWKKNMTLNEQKIYESVASDCLSLHGYEVKHADHKISRLLAMYYVFEDRLKFVKHLFVMNVIDGVKIKLLKKQPFND